jgi:hypothetical protein
MDSALSRVQPPSETSTGESGTPVLDVSHIRVNPSCKLVQFQVHARRLTDRPVLTDF